MVYSLTNCGEVKLWKKDEYARELELTSSI